MSVQDLLTQADALTAAAQTETVEVDGIAVTAPVATPKPPKKVLTRAEKIVDLRNKAQAYLDQATALETEENAAALFSGIKKGDTATIKVGRGDTRRQVTGRVVQRLEEEGRVYVKVFVTEGDDAELFRVQLSEVVSVEAAAVV